MLAAAVGAIAACGLDLLATSDGPLGGGPDGTADAPLGDGPLGGGDGAAEGSQIDLPPVPDPFLDAGLDVNQENCLAGCDGGACDAGWCVYECEAGTCTANTVQCPEGIPCEVNCRDGACTKGIDCSSATACRLGCSGLNSCTTKPIECSGVACSVACTGDGTCTNGVHCDAGACTVVCLGLNSCKSKPVTCNANTCTVRCGGPGSCAQGVRCDATQRCDVGCSGLNSCVGQPVSARSDGTSIVECTGQGTCDKGSILGGGGEAGVVCSGPGSCATKTFCDAGKCSALCDNVNFNFCCKAGTICELKTNNCSIKDAGCP